MASRHKYQIRPSQELLANGCCNLAGAFFSSLPVATSLSRTLVQVGQIFVYLLYLLAYLSIYSFV